MPEDEIDDRHLMESLIGGDHRALEAIIAKWERPLYSFTYRYTQNEGASRDIVQETFVRIFIKRDRYDSKYAFSSWIFAIAANLCKNKARWHKRHPEVSLETPVGSRQGEEAERRMIDLVPAESREPSAALAEGEELDLLREAVMGLPHDLRTAVLLHHYENVPYKEIADVVGCSIRGVETRLYRARKLLRIRINHALRREDARQKKKRTSISHAVAGSSRRLA